MKNEEPVAPQQVAYHDNGLSRVLPRHEHVTHIQGEAHVGPVHPLNQKDSGRGQGYREELGVLFRGIVFNSEVDPGICVAALPEVPNQLVLLLVIIDLEGIVAPVLSAPNHHLVAPKKFRRLRPPLGELDHLLPEGSIGVVHISPSKLEGISEANGSRHKVRIDEGNSRLR